MFDAFIGLDPVEGRRSTAHFVRAISHDQGFETLNRIWDEPDAFPTDAELADPGVWLARMTP